MTFKITDKITSVGVQNPSLRIFDIVMETEFGTSYNSFIVKGEKTALIETCHDDKCEEFFANIDAATGGGKIDYIILNHTEPDHSGCLRQALSRFPEALVYCSQAASIYLKKITNLPELKPNVVKDGDSLDLGGLSLKFISAPFLHWPDSIFTYVPEEKTVFTCDFLGAHYSQQGSLDTEITVKENYFSALKNYFDAIFGPFLPYVRSGLQKLEALEFERVCVSHGPVLSNSGVLAEVLRLYYEWSKEKEKPAGKFIPVFFCSAYGNTASIAESIKAGICSVLKDADVMLFNIIEHDICKQSALLNSSDAFLIGTPTINRDALPPVWQLLSHIDAINIQKRPCAVFGSYGWSGEGVPAVMSRLAVLKCGVFGEGLKINFVPNDADKQKAFEFGKAFAQSL